MVVVVAIGTTEEVGAVAWEVVDTEGVGEATEEVDGMKIEMNLEATVDEAAINRATRISG